MASDRDVAHDPPTDPFAELDPFADRPDRTPMYDDDGRLLLVSTLTTSIRHGLRWAADVWRPLTTPAADAAAALRQAMAGCLVSTADEALGAALADAGALVRRHHHVMRHRLGSIGAMPAVEGLVVSGLPATDLLEVVDPLAAILVAAYPAGHPDHHNDTREDAVAELVAIARGEALGSYLPVSTIALADGDVVGACLVVDKDDGAFRGGPWAIEVFRDPGCPLRAVGRSLVVGTLTRAREAHLPQLGLFVTDQNLPARRLYDLTGFEDVGEGWTFAVPDSRRASCTRA